MEGEQQTPDYWDGVSLDFNQGGTQSLWRRHSDRVNRDWVRQSLLRHPPASGPVLKTDLFDEAITGGFQAELENNAGWVAGIDISHQVLSAARQVSGMKNTAQADVRRLPFSSESFDLVVSNSTLDHFEDKASLDQSFAELFRVLRPGGQLLLSLDNLQNPLIWLRNTLPHSPLKRIGLVPYYVGHTLNRKQLTAGLEATGFRVLETQALLHCPRVLAVALARRLQHKGSERSHDRFLSAMQKFESMASWPTRFFTGHFVSALALRPGDN